MVIHIITPDVIAFYIASFTEIKVAHMTSRTHDILHDTTRTNKIHTHYILHDTTRRSKSHTHDILYDIARTNKILTHYILRRLSIPSVDGVVLLSFD